MNSFSHMTRAKTEHDYRAPGSPSFWLSRRFHASASLRSARHFGCHCHRGVCLLPLPLGHLAVSLSPCLAASMGNLLKPINFHLPPQHNHKIVPASFIRALTHWFIYGKAVSPDSVARNLKKIQHKWLRTCPLISTVTAIHKEIKHYIF